MEEQKSETFVFDTAKANSLESLVSATNLLASLLENTNVENEDSEVAESPTADATLCTSPIHTLPTELLGQIFTASVNANAKQPLALVPPLLLCQVSHLWRDIAISMPQLWQKLTLHYPSSNKVQRAMLWLSRASATYPVIIEIKKIHNRAERSQARAEWAKPSAEYLHQFAPIIGGLIFDWRTVNHSDTYYVHFLSLPTRPTYPLLRSLTILGGENGHLSRSHALNLKDPVRDIVWAQLTDLTITQRLPIIPESDILSLCTSLVKGEMHFICTVWQPPPSSTPIESRVLPSLQSLITKIFTVNIRSANHSVAYSHLFDTLTLPALKNFDLEVHHLRRDIDERFMAFKLRSSLDLVSFRLEDPDADISALALAEFLNDMPSLSSINMTGSMTPDPVFLRELTRHGGADRLAPNLTKVTFKNLSAPPDNSMALLYDMIDSRADGGTWSRVRKVCLEIGFWGWVEADDLRKRAKERGVDVRLKLGVFVFDDSAQN